MFQRARILRGHAAPVYAVAADDTFIYSSAGDRFVARWDRFTGVQDAFSIRLEEVAYAIAHFFDVLIIGTSRGTFYAIDTRLKQQIWESNFFGSAIFALEYCEKNQLIYAGDAASNLILIDQQGKKKLGFNLNAGKIKSLLISDDYLLVGTQDGKLRVFDVETMNELFTVQAHQKTVNALVCVDQLLISGGSDGHISVVDLKTMEQIRYFPAHYQSIYGLKVVGGFLVSASMDKTIKIWQRSDWKVVQRIPASQGGHQRSVNGLQLLSNESFVSVSDDKTLIVWEMENELNQVEIS
jgi:WD40 repeat protein